MRWLLHSLPCIADTWIMALERLLKKHIQVRILPLNDVERQDEHASGELFFREHRVRELPFL